MASLTSRKAALAFLSTQHHYRQPEYAKGQLLYLLRTGSIVVPETRTRHGWDCLVVCGREGQRGRRVPVADVEIATALSLRPPDPSRDIDIVVFVAIWQARVFDRWPPGPVQQVAAVLAHQARRRGSIIVDVGDAVARSVFDVCAIHPRGLRRLLAKLTARGLLSPVRHDRAGLAWRYLMMIPEPATAPYIDVAPAAA